MTKIDQRVGQEHAPAPHHQQVTQEHAPACRIILAGGGTGGHIYPALAVAAELCRLSPQVEFLYIGGDRMETQLVPAAGIPFRSISVHGLAGRGWSSWRRRLRSLVELVLGIPLFQSLSLLRGFNPNVVVATGGYVSGPVLLAARLLHIPSLALEGNRIPGWTSRAISRLVNVMAVAWREEAQFFESRIRPDGQVKVTGLPIRSDLMAISREAGTAALGLDPAQTTLLILGGSLGSRSINENVIQALAILNQQRGNLADLQVLHMTGSPKAAARCASEMAGVDVTYKAVAYLEDNYGEALAAADLVIARSGASTVAELAARGVASILIPRSWTSAGEQALNAQMLERAGAAVVIPNAELSSERLARVLIELLWDNVKREHMANAARSLGRPQAAEEVARLALALAGSKANP